MKKSSHTLLLLFALSSTALWAQQENKDLRSGNKQYKSEKYTEAEVAYRKALEKNNKSFEANFNLGNALYRQEKYSDALDYFDRAGALSGNDKQKKAAALHNIGNSLLSENKIQESIEAYKNALRNTPKDNDIRYNMAYAQSLLKKQQQNQQQQQQEKQNEEQKQEEEQKKQQQEKPKAQQQQQQARMSKENAQQILDALMQDEKEAKDKQKKEIPAGNRKVEKDW